mmetsp:Transcript_29766/g.41102  ORF Transcript_29766/g.41102 Transcript_29766/m.41102 type:complete len:208 (-) Transcript_29766:32-655(-)|eukprot:CAMPEP_0196595190 /NCGR_PEP_ID=MMETSP1081-20130531/80435_1 /TAXON_ID=36882 /ORGANISM="Pyramimonas amylifera, Strain CCMP720" /LENGTH=207 /DNA_ID=CAMNT_0041919691 /DNA_START=82 /DNA_END=705 /DNA_ORIENTATION=-
MTITLEPTEVEIEGSDGEGGWVSDEQSRGSDESWKDPSGGPLGELQTACESGETEKVPAILERLFETGVSVNSLGSEGDTALHLAALHGHNECVRLLLAAGADPQPVDEDGGTPLHDACAGGYLEIVQLLLSVGAEKGIHNCADNDEDTPLHNASRGNHEDVVGVLLETGANANLVNAAGNLPSDLCNKGSAIHLQLLRAAGITKET